LSKFASPHAEGRPSLLASSLHARGIPALLALRPWLSANDCGFRAWLSVRSSMSADELKAKGNAAFSAKNYDEAIDFFSQGIAIDPNNHVLFSNRSACHAGNKVIIPPE